MYGTGRKERSGVVGRQRQIVRSDASRPKIERMISEVFPSERKRKPDHGQI
jgi:hypothetical protein